MTMYMYYSNKTHRNKLSYALFFTRLLGTLAQRFEL